MKTLVWLAAFALFFAAASSTEDVLAKWNAFKVEYGKNYLDKASELRRLNIFKDNLVKIDAHNERFRQGLATYHMGVNQFADMTAEEFKQYNKLNVNRSQAARPQGMPFVPKPNAPQDNEVDWRNQGAVTGVKNQGSCGSCWSFSTTGSLEGQYFLRTGQLVSLSEQYLVDCSRGYGNAGCSGGWMDSAFEFVRDNGIYAENAYPYEAIDDNCRQPDAQIVLRVTNYYDIAQGSEPGLQQAVGSVGPISVALDASNWQFYSGGVYYDSNCDAGNLNHGVLVVGYGNQDGYDYWLVKNSWGDGWGEGGYVKVIRNYGNHCGIATAASYPSV